MGLLSYHYGQLSCCTAFMELSWRSLSLFNFIKKMLGVDFYFPPFVLNKSAPCIIYMNNKKFIKVSWEADEHLIEINANR